MGAGFGGAPTVGAGFGRAAANLGALTQDYQKEDIGVAHTNAAVRGRNAQLQLDTARLSPKVLSTYTAPDGKQMQSVYTPGLGVQQVSMGGLTTQQQRVNATVAQNQVRNDQTNQRLDQANQRIALVQNAQSGKPALIKQAINDNDQQAADIASAGEPAITTGLPTIPKLKDAIAAGASPGPDVISEAK